MHPFRGRYDAQHSWIAAGKHLFCEIELCASILGALGVMTLLDVYKPFMYELKTRVMGMLFARISSLQTNMIAYHVYVIYTR